MPGPENRVWETGYRGAGSLRPLGQTKTWDAVHEQEGRQMRGCPGADGMMR